MGFNSAGLEVGIPLARLYDSAKITLCGKHTANEVQLTTLNFLNLNAETTDF